jgi:hypothetical protein
MKTGPKNTYMQIIFLKSESSGRKQLVCPNHFDREHLKALFSLQVFMGHFSPFN